MRSPRLCLLTGSIRDYGPLPDEVACVDLAPATVTKLTDRGGVQTVGVVTDVEPFLRALAAELAKG